MAKDKTQVQTPQQDGENNPSSEAIIDIDSFLTQDGISPVWINGLRVFLTNNGGLRSRSLEDWRSALKRYQKQS